MSKERPILFTAQMVSATLEGRKTQTRHTDRKSSAIERFQIGPAVFIAPKMRLNVCGIRSTVKPRLLSRIRGYGALNSIS